MSVQDIILYFIFRDLFSYCVYYFDNINYFVMVIVWVYPDGSHHVLDCQLVVHDSIHFRGQ